MNSRRHATRAERMQERREAGSVAERFPEVVGILINMTYKEKGIKSIVRTFPFSRGSYAFFKADCLHQDCVDGGFDLTRVVTSMIRSRGTTAKGELTCESSDPSSDHAAIVYEVAIQYVQ